MRTTIRLDEQLLKKAKEYAMANGKTFTATVEEALREKLMERPSAKTKRTIKLKTVNGKGIKPGIDLDDSASLLDFMDEHDVSA